MLAWSTILYGAALSAVLAALLVFVLDRRMTLAAIALVSAAIGPLAWNAVLRVTHANQFFTDAPIALMPASWQDTDSGIATFALAATILGLGPLSANGRRAISLAAGAGIVAFLVDVYLY